MGYAWHAAGGPRRRGWRPGCHASSFRFLRELLLRAQIPTTQHGTLSCAPAAGLDHEFHHGLRRIAGASDLPHLPGPGWLHIHGQVGCGQGIRLEVRERPDAGDVVARVSQREGALGYLVETLVLPQL